VTGKHGQCCSNGQKPLTEDEWRTLILATAGSISDLTFERLPQGKFEER
jgi:hypothetical protein